MMDYDPRPFWTPAERAGIKALGKLWQRGLTNRSPMELQSWNDAIAEGIDAYVQAARAVKDKT